MLKLFAFFNLIRWKNLLFIILTQLLFQWYVEVEFKNAYEGFTLLSHTQVQGNWCLLLLILASVCIAAGGNIINDYFDIDIDLINKPEKTYAEKVFKRRTLIKWHFLLSLIGLACTALVAWYMNNAWILVYNLATVMLLVIYSAVLKKTLLVGNMLIALLTAWVIGVLFYVQMQFVQQGQPHDFPGDILPRFIKISSMYLLFTFIATLIREAIKDIEDIDGDRANDCNTMPIKWGIRVTKMYVGLLCIMAIVLLSGIAFYCYWWRWYAAFAYIIFVLVSLFVFLLVILRKAKEKNDFGTVSSITKLLMLFGILSLLLFIYNN
jgi:4-hydroxybenzoate polyprenyltransferase